jgi:16S rRNA (uracil1498-N3)-methyltransferase
MQPGDELELVDGSGLAYEGRIDAVAGDRVHVSILGKSPARSEPSIQLTMGLGFLKEKRMDFLVRHLTELGVWRLAPIYSARAVARPPDKRLHARIARWRSIAKEAVKQCGRGRIPDIAWPASFDEALQKGGGYESRWIFWEGAGTPLPSSPDPLPCGASVFALVGPEGGFTEAEAEAAARGGFLPVSLGPRILRAETAAITACALLQHLFGDLAQKSP